MRLPTLEKSHARSRALAEYRQAPCRPSIHAAQSCPADASGLQRRLQVCLALRLLGRVRGERAANDPCPAHEDAASLVSVCGVVWQ